MKLFQRLKAPNSVNGNPQRLFVVYETDGDDPSIIEILDEGFAGTPKHLQGVAELPSVKVTAAEYHSWRAGKSR